MLLLTQFTSIQQGLENQVLGRHGANRPAINISRLIFTIKAITKRTLPQILPISELKKKQPKEKNTSILKFAAL